MSIREERGRKKTHPLGSISPSSPRSVAAATFPPPSSFFHSFLPPRPGVFTVRSREALPSAPLPLPRMFSHMDTSSIGHCIARSSSAVSVSAIPLAGGGRGPPWRRCRQRRDRWRQGGRRERCGEEPIICSPIHSFIRSFGRSQMGAFAEASLSPLIPESEGGTEGGG